MEKLINDCIKLGFGMMRLPRISRNGMEVIDVERTADMVDAFLAAGGKYFDTAYVYDDGASEEAFRLAVAERYPRDAYYVCTKLNAGYPKCVDEAFCSSGVLHFLRKNWCRLF